MRVVPALVTMPGALHAWFTACGFQAASRRLLGKKLFQYLEHVHFAAASDVKRPLHPEDVSVGIGLVPQNGGQPRIYLDV